MSSFIPYLPGPSAAGAAQSGQQAYVIEVGETQAGLVNRRADERFFTFISAAAAFNQLEGQRFATPHAAVLAARHLLRGRRSGARLAA
jgi:hypothetical protein